MPYLGNTHTRQFHDLERQTSHCRVETIRARGHAVSFTPDTLDRALLDGYEPCAYCLRTEADQLRQGGRLVPAASDIRAQDDGEGRVAANWHHPQVGEQGVTFDVYAALDPLQLFESVAASVPGASSTTIGGFRDGGEVFLAVIARKGWSRSAPSSPVRVRVAAAPPAVPATTTARTGRARIGSGLAFPLRVAASGRLAVEDGDDRLRSKIRQLLLTSPGERVNLPGYGTPLRDLVFDPLNEVLQATTEFTVAVALQQYLRDLIEVRNVRVTYQDNRLDIDIDFQRRSDLTLERVRLGLPAFGGTGG